MPMQPTCVHQVLVVKTIIMASGVLPLGISMWSAAHLQCKPQLNPKCHGDLQVAE